jgi:hypothetical protein
MRYDYDLDVAMLEVGGHSSAVRRVQRRARQAPARTMQAARQEGGCRQARAAAGRAALRLLGRISGGQRGPARVPPPPSSQSGRAHTRLSRCPRPCSAVQGLSHGVACARPRGLWRRACWSGARPRGRAHVGHRRGLNADEGGSVLEWADAPPFARVSIPSPCMQMLAVGGGRREHAARPVRARRRPCGGQHVPSGALAYGAGPGPPAPGPDSGRWTP